jgi:hypothetical protein
MFNRHIQFSINYKIYLYRKTFNIVMFTITPTDVIPSLQGIPGTVGGRRECFTALCMTYHPTPKDFQKIF